MPYNHVIKIGTKVGTAYLWKLDKPDTF